MEKQILRQKLMEILEGESDFNKIITNATKELTKNNPITYYGKNIVLEK